MFLTEIYFIGSCLEWFLFGKTSILHALVTSIEVVSGLYSGIFIVYLQFAKSKTVFYVLCLLYILSAATAVCDFLNFMSAIYAIVSNNSISSFENIFFLSLMQDSDALSLQFDNVMSLIIFRLNFVQATVSGCCDIIAQFALVHTNPSPIIRFIHLNLQRSTGVGSCGVKISVSWLSLHSSESHT